MCVKLGELCSNFGSSVMGDRAAEDDLRGVSLEVPWSFSLEPDTLHFLKVPELRRYLLRLRVAFPLPPKGYRTRAGVLIHTAFVRDFFATNRWTARFCSILC